MWCYGPWASYLEDDPTATRKMTPQDRVYRSLGHREREVGPATQIRNLDWLHRPCNNDFVNGTDRGKGASEPDPQPRLGPLPASPRDRRWDEDPRDRSLGRPRGYFPLHGGL